MSGSNNKTTFNELESNGFFDIPEIKEMYGNIRITEEYEHLFNKVLEMQNLFKGE
jgi:hypothetical protein